MRNLTIVIFFLLNTNPSDAQNPYSNNPWILGDSVMLDFNTSTPTISNSNMACYGGSASVHDTINNMHLYAATIPKGFIWNIILYNQLNIPVKNSQLIRSTLTRNSTLLLPSQNSNGSLYYLITVVSNSAANTGLYYSVITNSGGLDTGQVIVKNINVLPGIELTEGLTAIRHGNGKDWWILAHKYDQTSINGSNLFYIFLLDSNGISTPILQNIGTLNMATTCFIKFNANGEIFYFINGGNLIEKFNFDRCNGIISNPITLMPQNMNTTENFSACELSPDNTKLYVGANSAIGVFKLLQFDLTSTNIITSKCQVYQIVNTDFADGSLKLAPNGTIYWCMGDPFYVYNTYSMNLSAITSPNSDCSNVNFLPFSFYLGGHRIGEGTSLPNNPDYQLGPLAGSSCAPMVGLEEKTNEALSFKISPNPVSNILSINWATSNPQLRSIRVLDVHGRLINESLINSNDKSQQIDVSTLANGIYVIEIKSSNRSDFKRFIKQ